MNAIVVPDQTYESLQREANQQGQPVDAIVQTLIDEYLHNRYFQHIQEEMERYHEQHVQLLPLYQNKYIGMYQGEVLGSHEDGGKLQASLHKQYGDLPVLIVQVTDAPEKTFRSTSFHMEPLA